MQVLIFKNEHYFSSFLEKNKLAKETCLLADSGYLGINQFLPTAILPFKGKKLSKNLKEFSSDFNFIVELVNSNGLF